MSRRPCSASRPDETGSVDDPVRHARAASARRLRAPRAALVSDPRVARLRRARPEPRPGRLRPRRRRPEDRGDGHGMVALRLQLVGSLLRDRQRHPRPALDRAGRTGRPPRLRARDVRRVRRERLAHGGDRGARDASLPSRCPPRATGSSRRRRGGLPVRVLARDLRLQCPRRPDRRVARRAGDPGRRSPVAGPGRPRRLRRVRALCRAIPGRPARRGGAARLAGHRRGAGPAPRPDRDLGGVVGGEPGPQRSAPVRPARVPADLGAGGVEPRGHLRRAARVRPPRHRVVLQQPPVRAAGRERDRRDAGSVRHLFRGDRRDHPRGDRRRRRLPPAA